MKNILGYCLKKSKNILRLRHSWCSYDKSVYALSLVQIIEAMIFMSLLGKYDIQGPLMTILSANSGSRTQNEDLEPQLHAAG